MSTEKIEPALSAEEWARGQVMFKTRSQYDNYGVELMGRPDRVADWSGGKDSAVVVFDGSWAAPIHEKHRMAAAALLLHGRITWGMVDALREAYVVEPWSEGEPDAEARAMLDRIADLLESLLPPREP